MQAILDFLKNIPTYIYVIFVVWYIVTGIILTRLNKKMYRSGAFTAWVPIFNMYLLGSLVINRLFGFLYFLSIILIGVYHFNYFDIKTVIIIEDNIFKIILYAIMGLYIVFILIAIIKLFTSDPIDMLTLPDQKIKQTRTIEPKIEPKVETKPIEQVKEEPEVEIEIDPYKTAIDTWDPNKPIVKKEPEVTEKVQSGLFDDFDELPK